MLVYVMTSTAIYMLAYMPMYVSVLHQWMSAYIRMYVQHTSVYIQHASTYSAYVSLYYVGVHQHINSKTRSKILSAHFNIFVHYPMASFWDSLGR